MGNNVDLIQILGLPDKITCPICNKSMDSMFDDYDIDCGEPMLGNGKWSLDCYCKKCENEFTYNFKVKIEYE